MPKPQALSITLIPQESIGQPCELTHILFENQLAANEADIPTALYVPDQPTGERDLALAGFMDAWAELEHELAGLLHYVMGTKSAIARAVQVNTQSMAQFLELLTTLAPITLNEDERNTLSALRERVKTYNTKRNRIVHGFWSLTIKFRGEHGVVTFLSAEWERRYHPTDPGVAKRLGDQMPKELAAYVYSPERLIKTADEVRAVSADVTALSVVIAQTHYPQGLPE